MIDKEIVQVKELCDRAILSFMATDQIINFLEHNKWSEFTLAEGDFVFKVQMLNGGLKDD